MPVANHPVYTQVLSPQQQPMMAAAPVPTPNQNNQAQSAPAANEHIVTAPMVGTFYRATGPTATAFVEVGQKVKVGAILCIIEAMKMLNQIETDHAGVVKRILVENGQPIEFGQPLFVLGDE
jgi:acetyl-CoA carboxylase biotin carboxyl carrier protein